MPTDVLTARPGELAADYYSLNEPIKRLLLGDNVFGEKVVGVARYLHRTSRKQLTRDEVSWLHDNGIGVKVIYEETANEIDGGAERGARSARQAIALLDATFPDYPHGCTITACADTQVGASNFQKAVDYFDAFRDVLAADGRWVMSGYAGSYMVDHGYTFPGGVTYPGAGSWSRSFFNAINARGLKTQDQRRNVGAVTAACDAAGVPVPHMLQKLDASKLVDWLYIYKPAPFWLPGAEDPGPPRDPHPVIITTRYGDTGDAVASLQRALAKLYPNLVVDGQFGRQTRKFVKAFQRMARSHDGHTAVDGIAGPRTWAQIKVWGLA